MQIRPPIVSALIQTSCPLDLFFCDLSKPPSLWLPLLYKNIMPISAAMFRSERKNPIPQCPPRLDVQMLTPVIWSRMPNHFLNPEVGKVSERLGWMVECTEPLIMMALHIPEENRSETLTPAGSEFSFLPLIGRNSLDP